MAKPGRKSKLTTDITKVIVDALANGNTIQNACALAGINEWTYFNWIRKGDKGDPEYITFSQAVKVAHPSIEAWHVENIKNHAKRSWFASAWYLERSNPDRWALRKPEPLPVETEKAPKTSVDVLISTILAELEDDPVIKKRIADRIEAMSR